MLRTAVRWVAGLVAAVLASSFAVYAAVFISPGSPIAFLSGGRATTPEQRAALEEQYHLDDPLVVGYVKWLGRAVTGDLGDSVVLRRPVTDVIASAAPTTLVLLLYALVLIVVFGVAAGLLAGLRPGPLDHLVTTVAGIGIAVPSFASAVLLVALFAVELGWFPVFGAGEGLADRLWHLTLPAVALAISTCGLVASITRTAVREEQRSEHVQTAIVRGLPTRRVVTHHVLRNALIPVVTVIALIMGSLVAGAAIVEHAFQLNGIGERLVQAVLQKDFAVVQGISLVVVVVFILLTALTDLAYRALDPRIGGMKGRR